MEETREITEKELYTTWKLSLPPIAPRIREQAGRLYILDRLRHRYVALTPEEWVRQHFVNYLTTSKGYPLGRIANEITLQLKDKTLRADSVIYDNEHKAKMLIEYKAPSVGLNSKVLEQALAYNTLLQADYIVVSNGLKHYCWKVDYTTRQCVQLSAIPNYKDII